jgi:prepilin-type N-terminal cleavage/methylation domain-containing protein
MSQHATELPSRCRLVMLADMPRTRAGFTLVEILISIMIFVVVSAAMIGILMISTELFRRGEFGRAANDETVSVVGTIEDDLKHMIPAADGGWFYAEVMSGAGMAAGNPAVANGDCIMAFLVANPDPSAIQHDGTASRLMVGYGCYNQQILRWTEQFVTSQTDPQGKQDIINFVTNMPNALKGSYDSPSIVTTGCLHFGIYLAVNGDPADFPIPRLIDPSTNSPSGIDWERLDPTKGTVLPPWNGTAFDTNQQMTAGTQPVNWPMPNLLRVSLVLTGGGRFGPRGLVIRDTGSTLQISGLAGIPTIPGAMLRVDAAGGGSSEWIAYTGFSAGFVQCPSPRNARRTGDMVHNRGDVVRLGQAYSVVRSLPQ